MISTLQHTHYYRSSDVRADRRVSQRQGLHKPDLSLFGDIATNCALLHGQSSRREAPMHRILLALATLTIPISSMIAQPPAERLLASLPPQSTAIRGIVVPVPREIFDSLDKFADSNWRAVQRPELTRSRVPAVQAE